MSLLMFRKGINKISIDHNKLQLCLSSHNRDIMKEVTHKTGIISFRVACEGIVLTYSDLHLELKH